METQYPEVYAPLNIQTTKERLFDVQVNCSYVQRKSLQDTNQFEDTLICAHIDKDLPLKLDLSEGPIDHLIKLLDQDRLLSGKHKLPICVVSDIYTASGIRRKETLKPSREVFESVLREIRKTHFIILTGIGPPEIQEFDLNLKNKTRVIDLIGIVNESSLVITQVGSLLPIGEALGKRVISFLSANYRKSGDVFLTTITPKKVVCSNKSICFYDDEKNIIERSIQWAINGVLIEKALA